MFTKACIELNHGENIVTEAKTCHQFNEKFLKDEDMFSPSERVNVFGDQHAPVPFLAISAPSNRVMIFHGIRKLFVPFSYSHKNNGDMIAFCGDTRDKKIFPTIVKLEEDDFEEARGWFYPKIKSIMNIMDAKGVLQRPDDRPTVKDSKVIPLPMFLVPLVMNEGRSRSAVASFQVFVDKFLKRL